MPELLDPKDAIGIEEEIRQAQDTLSAEALCPVWPNREPFKFHRRHRISGLTANCAGPDI
jgi:hypothetical protein